jgi:cation diffusion facilitator CzcD-associated flavoprotein CzcO
MADDFARQVAKASAELRAMSKDVRKEIRPRIREAAQPMVAQAKANASWSTRIPGAIRMSIAKRGVDIKVSRKKAPHARPYEGITRSGKFRHPVFGNRDRWVSQATRPFLDPAVRQHRDKVRRALVDLVDDAARRHGFR